MAVMGDRSGLDLRSTTGEARDRASLDLPGVQGELLKALIETGKPVVLVLINGRPLALTEYHERLAAVIDAWLPGEYGSPAISDVLFGDYNPGGKLPVSFPRSVGQVPVFYNHKPSGGRSHWFGSYVEMPASPLYPFGHGLSYTEFSYEDLFVKHTGNEPDAPIEISFTVTNIGGKAGHETVQLYLHDKEGEVSRPVKQLYGFRKIFLEPAASFRITFRFPPALTAFYGRDMDYIVEPGSFEIMIGTSSEDIRLKGSFEIKGKRRSVKEKVFFSRSSIQPLSKA